jgi:beta-glucanase (GH16 family)
MNKISLFSNLVRKGLFLTLLLIAPIGTSIAGWEVQWIDRFDGNGVNWDNWTAQIQANYNNEVQCYTDDEDSEQRNYEVSDGTLKITARKQNINCPGLGGQSRTWTSGRLNSKDKAEFLYGRIEARLRFLELKGGTWPAFWMLENRIAEHPIKGDNDTINWPNPGAGEIDIWEWYANSGDQYITNFFNVGNCGAEIRPTYSGGAPDVMSFHAYAIEWTKDDIKFFMDDELVAQHDLSNCSQYQEPMFALLNVAMGGNIGGAIDPTLTSATMEVDYVAHCIATDDNDWQQCNQSTPLVIDDDNDGVGNNLDQCPNTAEGVTVGADGCEVPEMLTEPAGPAPVPAHSPENVISVFSDSYVNIQDVDYNPNWGQATQVTEIQIEGNTTLKYSGLNYQGTDFDANHQNVSALATLHVDYWTNNATDFKLYLISPGPQETAFTVNIVQQSWQSIDIPLSAFNGVDLTDVFQLKVEGNGTIYLDNIYFSSDAQPTDSDGDGVADNLDQCPNTAPATEVDNMGCPLAETNVAPTVSLYVSQGGSRVTTVSAAGGIVTVVAEVSDENTDDSHSLVWTASNLASFNTNGAELTFNPTGLAASQLVISVDVTDSGEPALSSQATLNLAVSSEPEASEKSGGGMGIIMLLWLILIALAKQILHISTQKVSPQKN